MGKYAYVKIEYYIISQINELVNMFCKISRKIFFKLPLGGKKGKESRYRGVIITL